MYLILLTQVYIKQSEEVPQEFQRIEGSTLAVPKGWFMKVLSDCKDKTQSYKLKMILNGFFQPKDMAGRNSSTMRLEYPGILKPLERKLVIWLYFHFTLMPCVA